MASKGRTRDDLVLGRANIERELPIFIATFANINRVVNLSLGEAAAAAVLTKPSAERAALVGTLLPLVKDAFDASGASPPNATDLYRLLDTMLSTPEPREGFSKLESQDRVVSILAMGENAEATSDYLLAALLELTRLVCTFVHERVEPKLCEAIRANTHTAETLIKAKITLKDAFEEELHDLLREGIHAVHGKRELSRMIGLLHRDFGHHDKVKHLTKTVPALASAERADLSLVMVPLIKELYQQIGVQLPYMYSGELLKLLRLTDVGELLRLEEPDEKDAKVNYWHTIQVRLTTSYSCPQCTSDMVLAGMLQLPILMNEFLSKQLLPALGASFKTDAINVKFLEDLKIALPEGPFWPKLWSTFLDGAQAAHDKRRLAEQLVPFHATFGEAVGHLELPKKVPEKASVERGNLTRVVRMMLEYTVVTVGGILPSACKIEVLLRQMVLLDGRAGTLEGEERVKILLQRSCCDAEYASDFTLASMLKMSIRLHKLVADLRCASMYMSAINSRTLDLAQLAARTANLGSFDAAMYRFLSQCIEEAAADGRRAEQERRKEAKQFADEEARSKRLAMRNRKSAGQQLTPEEEVELAALIDAEADSAVDEDWMSSLKNLSPIALSKLEVTMALPGQTPFMREGMAPCTTHLREGDAGVKSQDKLNAELKLFHEACDKAITDGTMRVGAIKIEAKGRHGYRAKIIAPRQSKQVTKAKIDELEKYSPTLAAVYRKIAKDKYAFVELSIRGGPAHADPLRKTLQDGKGGRVLVRIARQLYGRSRISFFVSRANGMYPSPKRDQLRLYSLLREPGMAMVMLKSQFGFDVENEERVGPLPMQLHAGEAIDRTQPPEPSLVEILTVREQPENERLGLTTIERIRRWGLALLKLTEAEAKASEQAGVGPSLAQPNGESSSMEVEPVAREAAAAQPSPETASKKGKKRKQPEASDSGSGLSVDEPKVEMAVNNRPSRTKPTLYWTI